LIDLWENCALPGGFAMVPPKQGERNYKKSIDGGCNQMNFHGLAMARDHQTFSGIR
jgi:hypothetical protein